jgi:DNA-binding FadR family transcriptional regulator
MTGHIGKIAASYGTGKMALLTPLSPIRNRTDEVIERITAEITSGRLEPGGRLPTEQELMTAMGVSRTVVREAVAALKAEGLVVTRQGSGAYVASDRTRMPFRIQSTGTDALGSIVQIMELRLAVEVEAAALAAERATASAIKTIERAFQRMDRAIDTGEIAVSEDFAFHQAIADATGNMHFKELLSFLGRHVIPRQSIRTALTDRSQQAAYLARLQNEHGTIVAAIRAHDPAKAQRAMRAHLSNSLRRYRSLAAGRVA